MKNLGIVLICSVCVAFLAGCGSNAAEKSLQDRSNQPPSEEAKMSPDKVVPKAGETQTMATKRMLGRPGGLR